MPNLTPSSDAKRGNIIEIHVLFTKIIGSWSSESKSGALGFSRELANVDLRQHPELVDQSLNIVNIA